MKLESKAIRAGLSVLICLLLSRLLDLKYPFFVVLPSIMPISYSVQETVKAGVNRAMGTIIGATAGVCLAAIQPGNPYLSAIGIVMIIYLCSLIKWGSSASIAGLIFISIMVGIKGENPAVYSLHRIVDTLIGILVTIVVNNVIFHADLTKVIEKGCSHLSELLLSYVHELVFNGKILPLDNIKFELESIQKQQAVYSDEYVFRMSNRNKLDELKAAAAVLESAAAHLGIAAEVCTDGLCSVNNGNLAKLQQFFNRAPVNTSQGDDIEEKVFNYHLGIILDNLLSIRSLRSKGERNKKT